MPPRRRSRRSRTGSQSQNEASSEAISRPSSRRNRTGSQSGEAASDSSAVSRQRRSSAVSTASRRTKTKASSKRRTAAQLSPEELAEQHERRQGMMRVVGGSVLVAVIIVVVFVIMLPDPSAKAAKAALASARSNLPQLKSQIRAGDVDGARARFEQLQETLAAPELDKGVYQAKAEQLRASLDQLEEQLQAAVDRQAAKRNLAVLKRRLDAIGEEPDLAALQAMLEGFRRNPVDPAGIPMANAEQDYKDLILQVSGEDRVIAEEQARRADTSDIERQAMQEVEQLVQKRQYRKANDYLSDLKEQHPNADFSTTSDYLSQSQQREWKAVSQQVRDKVRVASGAGVSDAVRQAELSDARKLLKTVEEQFNADYVDQAEALRQEMQL